MKTYTTVQGDTWDLIAKNELGGESLTGELMRQNPDYLGYFVFEAGIVLTLPETDTATTSSLPPWKQ